ncbi:MAG TPA: hypothetical protein VK279_02530 [Solirubrobacteraceae bacterium]|nr:hypothetical protein [Solirubrobacteraceae bacterium]
MDGSPLAVFMVVLFVLFLVAIVLLGLFHPRRPEQLLDWKPTRSPEVEAELEVDDIDQMLEAQNARRRRRGAPELSVEDLELRVAADRREDRRRRDAYLAEREGGLADEDRRQMEEALARRRRKRDRERRGF